MTHPDIERYVRGRLGIVTDADRDAERRKLIRYRPARPTFSVQSADGSSMHDAPTGIKFASGGVSVDGDIITVPSYGLSVGGTPTVAAINAGDTVSLADHTDGYGLVTIVPSAARAAGSMIEITFGAAHATADFSPQLTAATVAAASANGYFTGRTTTRWRLATANALSAGVTYTWGFHIRG